MYLIALSKRFTGCVSTSGSQTQIPPRAKLEPMKQPDGRIMTLTQQWRYLNLPRNSFYILYPAKGIVSYWQIISSHVYVPLK